MRDERPHLLLGVLAGTGEAMRLVAREGAPVAEVEVDLVYGVGDVLPLAQHRRLHAHAVGRLELVGLPVDLDLLGVSVHQPFELAQHGVHRGGELEGVGEGTGERLQRVRAEQLQAVLEAAPLAQGVAQVLPHVVPHVLRGRGVVAVARALHALLRRAHRDLEGGGAIVEYVDDPPLGEQVADLPSGPRRRAVGSGTSPEEVAARPLVLKVPVVELVLHDVRLRADLGVGAVGAVVRDVAAQPTAALLEVLVEPSGGHLRVELGELEQGVGHGDAPDEGLLRQRLVVQHDVHRRQHGGQLGERDAAGPDEVPPREDSLQRQLAPSSPRLVQPDGHRLLLRLGQAPGRGRLAEGAPFALRRHPRRRLRRRLGRCRAPHRRHHLTGLEVRGGLGLRRKPKLAAVSEGRGAERGRARRARVTFGAGGGAVGARPLRTGRGCSLTSAAAAEKASAWRGAAHAPCAAGR